MKNKLDSFCKLKLDNGKMARIKGGKGARIVMKDGELVWVQE